MHADCRAACGRPPGLTSTLINDQLRMNLDSSIVAPFSPDQVKNYQQGYNRHYPSRCRAYSCILDRFGKGVETRKSRFRRHGVDLAFVQGWIYGYDEILPI